MTVAEALSNLVFAAITDLRDVKCSGNWMWAAKLPGEGETSTNKQQSLYKSTEFLFVRCCPLRHMRGNVQYNVTTRCRCRWWQRLA